MHDAVRRWNAWKDYLSQDALGGPRPLRFAWVINVQKGGTLLFVLGLMAWFGRWDAAAFTYLALHGSYGLCWLLKEAVFPDRNWQVRITLPSALLSWLFVLGPYWIAPIILMSTGVEVSTARLAFATILHTLGVVIMMGADTQKYFVLQARRGLITDGWFGRVRHPNYLGEMMLYAAYAVIVQHWAPWLVLGAVWGGVFLPNMLAKEASMARYPEWAAYKARTGMLLPWPGRATAPAPSEPDVDAAQAHPS